MTTAICPLSTDPCPNRGTCDRNRRCVRADPANQRPIDLVLAPVVTVTMAITVLPGDEAASPLTNPEAGGLIV